MSVVAKFTVNSIEEYVGQKTVKLSAVYGNGEANKQWSIYTPSGTIQMTITNPNAYDQFKVGSDYYVTFEEVPA